MKPSKCRSVPHAALEVEVRGGRVASVVAAAPMVVAAAPARGVVAVVDVADRMVDVADEVVRKLNKSSFYT